MHKIDKHAKSKPKTETLKLRTPELTNEYKQLIDKINATEKRLKRHKQQANTLAKQHASDIAGICAIAKASMCTSVIPLFFYDWFKVHASEQTYKDGYFLFNDNGSQYVADTLGIDLNYKADATTLSGISYYIDKDHGIFVSSEGEVWWSCKRQSADLTDIEASNAIYAMFTQLPILKNALFEYVEKQIGNIPDLDALFIPEETNKTQSQSSM